MRNKMKEYNFVEFQPKDSKYNITISLGRPNRFYLANAFCTKNNIEVTDRVKLFYDKNKKAVGFKFLKADTPNTISLKKISAKSLYINSTSFLGMNDVSTDKYLGKYKPIEILAEDGGKIFVVELKEKYNS